MVGRKTHVRKSFISHNRSNVVWDMDYENALMKKCEGEQRVIDRFWGFEKEAAEREADLKCMGHEDYLSQLLNAYERSAEQLRVWEQEYEQEKFNEAYAKALQEENKRKLYMKHFFAAR